MGKHKRLSNSTQPRGGGPGKSPRKGDLNLDLKTEELMCQKKIARGGE